MLEAMFVPWLCLNCFTQPMGVLYHDPDKALTLWFIHTMFVLFGVVICLHETYGNRKLWQD